MRQAKSYSIVDHALLHGGFLARLTHPALALYLFLCVVGDKEGVSYYGGTSVMRILRFSRRELDLARSELVAARLIGHRGATTQVLSLTTPAGKAPFPQPSCVTRASVQTATGAASDAWPPIRGAVPDGLRSLLASLGER